MVWAGVIVERLGNVAVKEDEPKVHYSLVQNSGKSFSLKDVIKVIKEGITKGGERMSSFVLGFQDIDQTKLMVVGGKGANLGELSRIEGIRVPDGFCISTEAFKRTIGENSSIDELLDQLSLLKIDEREIIGELSAEIRRVIEGIAIPDDINEEITSHLSGLGEKNAYALRSSATAEDLPTASFASQQDTYLNINVRPESCLWFSLKDMDATAW